MLLLAVLVGAAIIFSGPRYFYRWQRRKDGVRERYWRYAGAWEIFGLGLFAAVAIAAMGRD